MKPSQINQAPKLSRPQSKARLTSSCYQTFESLLPQKSKKQSRRSNLCPLYKERKSPPKRISRQTRNGISANCRHRKWQLFFSWGIGCFGCPKRALYCREPLPEMRWRGFAEEKESQRWWEACCKGLKKHKQLKRQSYCLSGIQFAKNS